MKGRKQPLGSKINQILVSIVIMKLKEGNKTIFGKSYTVRVSMQTIIRNLHQESHHNPEQSRTLYMVGLQGMTTSR